MKLTEEEYVIALNALDHFASRPYRMNDRGNPIVTREDERERIIAKDLWARFRLDRARI